MKTILLDLDGVLANWMRSAAAIIGEDEGELRRRFIEEEPDAWGIQAILDIPIEDLWARIHEQGRSFWAELDPYPWATDLYERCRAIAPTYVLTSPSRHYSSPAGKVEWMDRHLGRGEPFRDFLIGSPKHLCARPGTLLIDDRPANVDRFVQAGGGAILFPQPWNRARRFSDDPLGFVFENDRLTRWRDS